MGALFSKTTTGEGSSHNARPQPQTSPNSQVTPDLSSYEAACQLDPDLQSFDSTLRDRTIRVIKSLAAGVEVRSLSLDSLREVTDCFVEMNEEVVKYILECKRDIWNNKELFDLVEEYFETSLQTLDFCTVLEKCLKRARDSQFIIQVALQKFDEEQRDETNGNKLYLNTLQELKNFKISGDPFTDEFFLLFQSVYSKQVSMLLKLQKQKLKMDKKLNRIKVMRRVSMIIFAATFTSVLICSVVAAAIAAPPVLTALATAAVVPLGSMGKWLNSIWKKYENEVKGQRDIISSMQMGTYIAIKDLDSILVLVQKLEIEIEALLQSADFAIREEEEAVVIAMEEIKKKSGGFMKTIEDLGERTDKCSSNIRKARTVILQRINKYPSST